MQEITPQILITTVVLIFLITPMLTLPIAFGLLRLYRWAVIRGMSAVTSMGNTPRAPLPAAKRQPSFSGLACDGTSDLHHLAVRGLWTAALQQCVAGMAFALVFATASFVARGLPVFHFMFLLMWWGSAWPIVLATNIIMHSTWRLKAVTTAVYIGVLALLTFAAMESANLGVMDFGTAYIPARSTITPKQTVLAWAIGNLPPTALLLTFLSRPVRAVGPLVLSFMTVVVTGVISTYWAMFYRNMPDHIIALAVRLHLDVRLILLGVVGLALVAFGVLGWGVLVWLRRGYRRKTISDQSLILDSVWLLFGIFYQMFLVLYGFLWGLSGLVAFFAYKLVVWLSNRLVLARTERCPSHPALLFLRVFSLGRRSERLFHAVAKHWRYIGSIQLIIGPDLATTIVGPHQFLEYLSGRLSRLFINRQAALQDRMHLLDTVPDADGRFRINDFFCRNNTWQAVLSRLVKDTRVVLIDLRSFTPLNDGCRHELNELIHVMPLPQVLLVVDATTDMEFLAGQLDEAWKTMPASSPNCDAQRGDVGLVQLKTLGSRDLQKVLQRLCRAAA
jgi:hypothetical protein